MTRVNTKGPLLRQGPFFICTTVVDRQKLFKLIAACTICIGTIVAAVYLFEWLFG